MNLLIKDRGAGKTTGLIYASEATGYPIVVSTHCRIDEIRNQADKLGVLLPEPLTFDEVKQRGRMRLSDNILIDEVQGILSEALDSYMGCHVVGATMTDRQNVLKKNQEIKRWL